MARREVVSVKDFHKIASENEFFIWHFLQKNQNRTRLGIHSIFDERISDEGLFGNPLVHVLENIEIPYFESYTEESVDFLMGFNISGEVLYKIPPIPSKKEQYYTPLFIGFNKFKYVGSSIEVCYCDEYLIELIMKMNPEFILNSKFD